MSTLRLLHGMGLKKRLLIYIKGFIRTLPLTLLSVVVLNCALFFGWELRCLTGWSYYTLTTNQQLLIGTFSLFFPFMARFCFFVLHPQFPFHKFNHFFEKSLIFFFVFCMILIPLQLYNTTPSSTAKEALSRLQTEKKLYTTLIENDQLNPLNSTIYKKNPTAPPLIEVITKKSTSNENDSINYQDTIDATQLASPSYQHLIQLTRINQNIYLLKSWALYGAGAEDALFGEINRLWIVAVIGGIFFTFLLLFMEKIIPKTPYFLKKTTRSVLSLTRKICRFLFSLQNIFPMTLNLKTAQLSQIKLNLNIQKTPRFIFYLALKMEALKPKIFIYYDKATSIWIRVHEHIVTLGLGSQQDLSDFERKEFKKMTTKYQKNKNSSQKRL